MVKQGPALAALLALMCCGNTRAGDDLRWYAGAGLQAATFDRDWSFLQRANDGSLVAQARDDEDRGLGLFLGMDVLQHLAIELAYVDLGEATFTAQSDGSGNFFNAGPVAEQLSVTAVSLGALLRLPLVARTSLVLRAGAQRSQSESSLQADLQCCGPVSLDGEREESIDFVYGAGLELDLGATLRLRLAYDASQFEQFSSQEVRISAVQASLAYRFWQ